MRGKKLLATLAVSAVLFTGCGLKSSQTIIKINDHKITQAQFDELFNQQASGGIVKALGIDLKDAKNNFMYLLIKERVVNELIVKELLNQEIQKREIKVTDKDVDGAIKEIVDKVGSKEQLNAILKQNGVSNSQFKNDLKQEIKVKKLADQLGSTVVYDAEAKNFYKENINKFKHPEKVRASHILISVNPEEIAELIKSDSKNKSLDEAQLKAKVNEEIRAREVKVDNILAEAKKDPSQFARLAKENSEDKVSAEKGGDLGFFAAQEMVPEFSKAAFALKPNTISDKPVKSQFGYHIIMVTDRAEAGTESYEKVADEIKSYLANKKQVDLIDNLIESLKKNADIKFVNSEYDPENIQKNVQDTMKKDSDKKPEETK